MALGRALARRPAILLLDEPLSSLDAPLRASLRIDLAALHGLRGMTTLHVTHDLEDARRLADQVFRLRDGTIEAIKV